MEEHKIRIARKVMECVTQLVEKNNDLRTQLAQMKKRAGRMEEELNWLKGRVYELEGWQIDRLSAYAKWRAVLSEARRQKAIVNEKKEVIRKLDESQKRQLKFTRLMVSLLEDAGMGKDGNSLCGMVREIIDYFRKLKGLLSVAKCPNCDGSGVTQIQTSCRQYVTSEMAMDAGCPEMAGSLYSDDEWELQQCQWCDERKQLLTETAGEGER
jgi:hypothetical protein